jgi:Tfp pilus assembly protein PilX
MNSKQRQHRGFSSVLALIYLVLLAALAVGFYTAVDLSGNIADNEQNVNRSALAAESGLAFARYAIAGSTSSVSNTAIHLSYNTTQSNLLAGILANLPGPTTQECGNNATLGNVVNGQDEPSTPAVVPTARAPAMMPTGTNTNCSIPSAGWSGNLAIPTTQPGIYATTQPSVAIPGWTTNSNVSTPNWMPIDNNGGYAYLILTQVPNSMSVDVMAVGSNSNARVTSVPRVLQLAFTTPTNPQCLHLWRDELWLDQSEFGNDRRQGDGHL